MSKAPKGNQTIKSPLYRLREETMKVTQSQLSDVLGVPLQEYQKCERVEQEFTARVKKGLKEILGVDVADLERQRKELMLAQREELIRQIRDRLGVGQET